jgi:xanthine permease XanP
MTKSKPREHIMKLLLVATQHVVALISFTVFPLLVAEAAGLAEFEKAHVFQVSLVALALANMLQAANLRFFGTQFLLPSGYTAAYLAPSIVAAKSGGLPLVAGMTAFAGLCVVLLSRLLPLVLPWIGREVFSVILTLIGVSNGLTGLRRLTAEGNPAALKIAMAALGVMLLATAFRFASFYSVLLGSCIGYAIAVYSGMIDLTGVYSNVIVSAPSLSIVRPSFDSALILPFAAVALIAAAKQSAFVEAAQKDDPSTPLPDAIRRSVAADGIGTIASALLGSLGVNASASSAGIRIATGISDRMVGWFITLILFLIAISPNVAAFAAKMPISIMAVVLIYTSIFVIASGVKGLRNLDAEKALIAGAGLLVGLAIESGLAPTSAAPSWLSGLLASSLAAGSATSLLLNLLLNLRSALTGVFSSRVKER